MELEIKKARFRCSLFPDRVLRERVVKAASTSRKMVEDSGRGGEKTSCGVISIERGDMGSLKRNNMCIRVGDTRTDNELG